MVWHQAFIGPFADYGTYFLHFYQPNNKIPVRNEVVILTLIASFCFGFTHTHTHKIGNLNLICREFMQERKSESIAIVFNLEQQFNFTLEKNKQHKDKLFSIQPKIRVYSK